MGIAHDTGGFSIPVRHRETMEAAANLMRKGTRAMRSLRKSYFEKS